MLAKGRKRLTSRSYQLSSYLLGPAFRLSMPECFATSYPVSPSLDANHADTAHPAPTPITPPATTSLR